MYQVYRVLAYCLLPLLIIVQWRKGFRNKAYWSHWNERFGFVRLPQTATTNPIVNAQNTKNETSLYDFWVHAVSVGEARAIAPLVKRLLSEQVDRKILITVSTPTGRDLSLIHI